MLLEVKLLVGEEVIDSVSLDLIIAWVKFWVFQLIFGYLNKGPHLCLYVLMVKCFKHVILMRSYLSIKSVEKGLKEVFSSFYVEVQQLKVE